MRRSWPILLLLCANFALAQTNRGPTRGPRRTLAVLLTYQDSPATRPFTREQLAQFLFNGPLQAYFNEVSYGQLSITGDVLDWTALPRNASVNGTCPSPSAAQTDIRDIVTRPGVNPLTYDQLILVADHPCFAGDGAAGLVQLPGSSAFLPQIWWGATATLDASTPGSALLILAHEIGHTMGADHARNWTCEERTLYGRCDEVEYGNPFDMMATAVFGMQFGAFYKEAFGWLDTQSVLTIDRSGRYTIRPLASATGVRAARILPPGYTRAPYYLEERLATGLDSRMDAAAARSNTNGLLVNQVVRGSISSAAQELGYPRLLDMRPGVPRLGLTDIQEASLNLGQAAFIDAARGITIGPVISVDANGVTFDVTIAPGQCVQPPSIGRLLRTSAALGEAGFDLQVDGSDFNASTAVRWNGSERATTLLSANRVRAQIPASDLTTPGSALVTVVERGTGCAGSGALFFDVLSRPTLTSISPDTVAAQSPETELTLTGTGFTSISVARYNGASLTTRYIDSTKLIATLPANFLLNPFSPAISVSTPGTGGGISNSINLTINVVPLPQYTRAGLVGIFYASANAGATCTTPGRGSVMSLYGQNLSAQTQFATSVPWPLTLGGTSVLINGSAVPIQAATPGQINFQAPLELEGAATLRVRTTLASGQVVLGPQLAIQIGAASPCFLAGPLGLIAVDPQARVVNATNPLPPGGAFLLYAAGLGQTDPPLVSAQATPFSPLSRATLPMEIVIDGAPAPVDFAGLTPGFVGLFQVNTRAPSGGGGTLRLVNGLVRVSGQEFRFPLFIR